MLKIAVSWGKRIKETEFNYASKSFKNKISQFSKKNMLLNIKISGVEEQDAIDAKNRLIKLLGYDPLEDSYFNQINQPQDYDKILSCIEESIVIPKDYDHIEEQKQHILDRARKIARFIKQEYNGITPYNHPEYMDYYDII